jgi:hypothetical protein
MRDPAASAARAFGWDTDKPQSHADRRLANKSIGPQLVCYFFPAALFLAAHRAFISWESLFRPAGVSPPFFGALLTPVRFRAAHRALIAAAIFARTCGDIPREPLLEVERDAVPRSEVSRFSRVLIWRRIESASSNFSTDMSMRCHKGFPRFQQLLFAFPHEAVIRVYDAAGNVIETYEHNGESSMCTRFGSTQTTSGERDAPRWL